MTTYKVTTGTTVTMTARTQDMATPSDSDSITLEFWRGDDEGVALTLDQNAWRQLRYLLADTEQMIGLIGVPAEDGSGDTCRDCGEAYPVVTDSTAKRRITSQGPLGGYQTCLGCAAGG